MYEFRENLQDFECPPPKILGIFLMDIKLFLLKYKININYKRK